MTLKTIKNLAEIILTSLFIISILGSLLFLASRVADQEMAPAVGMLQIRYRIAPETEGNPARECLAYTWNVDTIAAKIAASNHVHPSAVQIINTTALADYSAPWDVPPCLPAR